MAFMYDENDKPKLSDFVEQSNARLTARGISAQMNRDERKADIQKRLYPQGKDAFYKGKSGDSAQRTTGGVNQSDNAAVGVQNGFKGQTEGFNVDKAARQAATAKFGEYKTDFTAGIPAADSTAQNTNWMNEYSKQYDNMSGAINSRFDTKNIGERIAPTRSQDYTGVAPTGSNSSMYGPGLFGVTGSNMSTTGKYRNISQQEALQKYGTNVGSSLDVGVNQARDERTGAPLGTSRGTVSMMGGDENNTAIMNENIRNILGGRTLDQAKADLNRGNEMPSEKYSMRESRRDPGPFGMFGKYDKNKDPQYQRAVAMNQMMDDMVRKSGGMISSREAAARVNAAMGLSEDRTKQRGQNMTQATAMATQNLRGQQAMQQQALQNQGAMERQQLANLGDLQSAQYAAEAANAKLGQDWQKAMMLEQGRNARAAMEFEGIPMKDQQNMAIKMLQLDETKRANKAKELGISLGQYNTMLGNIMKGVSGGMVTPEELMSGTTSVATGLGQFINPNQKDPNQAEADTVSSFY